MSPGSRAAAEPVVRPRGRRPAHRRSGHRRRRSTAHRAWRAVNGGRSRSWPALPSSTMSSPEREFVRAHLDDLHADLDAWLRIPSISADPAHAADVAASAEWLGGGGGRPPRPAPGGWPTPGAPAVFAEWPSADPDAPVALVY